MRHEKRGYILIFTLSVMTIMIVMVTLAYTSAQSYFAYVKLIENRERAKALALSGVELSMSQLFLKQQKKLSNEELKEKDDKVKEQQKKGDLQRFFEQVFPILNRWQTMILNMPEDGLDGTIKYYIACEDGKINVNQYYDRAKKSLVGNPEQQKKLREFFAKITSAVKSEQNLLDGIEKMQKENRIIDVTQLIDQPGYNVFDNNFFMRMPMDDQQSTYPLTDIFTTWTSSNGICPWFMSQSLAEIVGLAGGAKSSMEERRSSMEQWLKEIKGSVSAWPQEWNKTLGKLYGTEWKGLPPGMELIFMTKFGPKTFSVVSYGISNGIIQKVFAIVERSGNSYGDVPYRIKKLYWI